MQLTARELVLAALRKKSPQTCYELAKLLDLQPASLSSTLNRMWHNGEIERGKDSKNPLKGMQYWIAKPPGQNE